MKLASTFVGTLLLLSAPISHAAGDITSYNHSPVDSTMRVMSGDSFKGMCATSIPMGKDGWVAANGGVKKFQAMSISFMCGKSFPCVADVYLSPNHDCQGEIVGTVSLSQDGVVTILNQVDGHILIGGDHTFTLQQ